MPRAQVAAGGSADRNQPDPADLVDVLRAFTREDWRDCLIGAPLVLAALGLLPFLLLVIEEIVR